MKYKYTSDEIEGPKFKYNPDDQHLDWLDYNRLWEWQESFFKRLNYKDGSNHHTDEIKNRKK